MQRIFICKKITPRTKKEKYYFSNSILESIMEVIQQHDGEILSFRILPAGVTSNQFLIVRYEDNGNYESIKSAIESTIRLSKENIEIPE